MLSRVLTKTSTALQAQRPRLFLWMTLAFAAGILAYMVWPAEPPSALIGAMAALAGLMIVLRQGKPGYALALLLSCGLLGVVHGYGYTHYHPPVMLQSALSPRMVEGTIEEALRNEHGYRLTLTRLTIARLSPEETPNRVRLTVRGHHTAPPPIGSRIRLMAGLRPPMGPVLPYGFDFARYFYFRDIGAVGYGLPPWELVADRVPHSLAQRFQNWRFDVTERMFSQLGNRVGSVAAGLITGDARAIPRQDFEALRASNLYHIIAISGEHMVLISGVIFIGLRLLALLVLPARLRLRPQIKSVAAAITLLLVTGYLFVTGTPTSAVRAYVMIALVLLAILLGRRPDALKSLAVTAWLMLLFNPGNALDPGFQLSFIATLSLICVVQSRPLAPQSKLETSRMHRILRTLFTLALMSAVAEAVTAPIVVAQFNNLSFYGIPANLLAAPIMSLYLMPLVALYFLLLPLGLEAVALEGMGYGIAAMLALANAVAALPHAHQFLPSPPRWGVACAMFGVIFCCLWIGKARWFGLLGVGVGVFSLWCHRLPDMLVGEELRQIAFRTPSGYVLARGRAQALIPTLWTNGLGYAALPAPTPDGWRCDRLGCLARLARARIAFPVDALAFMEDCIRADLVISHASGMDCKAPSLTGATLKHTQALAIWVEDSGGFRIESAGHWQGNRPWKAAATLEFYPEPDEDASPEAVMPEYTCLHPSCDP